MARFFLAVMGLGLCAACATSTGALPIGKDTYQITAEIDQGYGGLVQVQEKAVSEANAHCDELGREFVFMNSTNANYGTLITHQLVFRCVPAGDPEDVRPEITISD